MDTTFRKKYATLSIGALALLAAFGCSKDQVAQSPSEMLMEEQNTLASSSFFPGENAPGLRTALGSGESGTIAPPGGSTGGDGGTITPGGSTGSTSGNTSGGTTSGGTSTTPSGTTGGGTASNPTPTPAAGGNNSGSTASGGTSSGGTSSGTTAGNTTTPPAGSDGGTISGGTNNNGNDTGTVTPGGSTGSTSGGTANNNPSTGGSTTPGSTNPGSGSTGGTSGGVASNNPTPTPDPSTGSNPAGPSSGGTPVVPPSGNDGGTVNPGTGGQGGDTGGVANNNTGSTTPGSTTNPGSNTGSTTPGSGSTTGGTSGGVASNPTPTPGPSTGSTNPGGSTTNPGGVTPGSDGGTVVGGGKNPGSDGGTVTPGGGVANNNPGNNGGTQPGTTNPGTNPTTPGNTGGSTTNPTPNKPPTLVDLIKDILKKIEDVVKNNTPKPGNDGGTVTPPTDHANNEPGNTPCKGKYCADIEKKIKIDVGRVCSQMRSDIKYPKFVFFEEAKRPILSVEATVNLSRHLACERKQTQWASAGFSYYPVTTQETYSKSGVMNAVIHTANMSSVNMFAEHFKTEMNFKVNALKQQFPKDWRDIIITARICDDRNANGKCSDEVTPWVLSVAQPTFSLEHIPSSLSIEVWHGRHLTRASDPEICEKQYSPLILDLTGQGFSLSGPENGVYFDLDDTGREIATGWTNADNVAFLVRDINRNGNIDSGAELFGSATLLGNGKRAVNGFQALKDLDTTDDNKFTRDDAAWKSVKLWIDRNHNAHVDRGEMYRLEDYNIESINLDYTEIFEVDPFGNQTRERSTFRRTIKGKSVPFQIIDIWFNTLVGH